MTGKPIRVGIDTNGLYTTQAGVARYIRGLLEGFDELDAPDLETFPVAWEVENFSYRQPVRLLRTLYREALWARWQAPRIIRAGGADVFHATAGPGLSVPQGTRRVATIHDMAILRYPDRYRRWQRWSMPRRLRTLPSFDRLICISRFTADETMRCLGLPAARLVVVHNGCDFRDDRLPDEQRPDFLLPPEFFLFVGSLEPVKNLSLLRIAYERAAAQGSSLPPLVIVGARWQGVVGEGPPPADWLYAGRVPDNVLVYLYRRALALVFPSKYEGFGFPVVEAMTLGCPVICSRVSSLPEVGGDAPIYADPTPAAYLSTMTELAGNPLLRDRHIEAGRARAKAFSWRRCAEETRKVYQSVV